jgi:hypothetical protein
MRISYAQVAGRILRHTFITSVAGWRHMAYCMRDHAALSEQEGKNKQNGMHDSAHAPDYSQVAIAPGLVSQNDQTNFSRPGGRLRGNPHARASGGRRRRQGKAEHGAPHHGETGKDGTHRGIARTRFVKAMDECESGERRQISPIWPPATRCSNSPADPGGKKTGRSPRSCLALVPTPVRNGFPRPSPR